MMECFTMCGSQTSRCVAARRLPITTGTCNSPSCQIYTRGLRHLHMLDQHRCFYYTDHGFPVWLCVWDCSDGWVIARVSPRCGSTQALFGNHTNTLKMVWSSYVSAKAAVAHIPGKCPVASLGDSSTTTLTSQCNHRGQCCRHLTQC